MRGSWQEAEPERTLQHFAAKLGSVREQSKPKGGVSLNVGTSAIGFVGFYEVPCSFERGEGRVRVRLVRDWGAWRLASFHVQASALGQ